MKFFNRLVQFYAVIVILLTLLYYYVATRIHVDSDGNSSVWWALIYIFLLFLAAFIFTFKDESSGYGGLNYHLTSYLIVSGLSLISLWWDDPSDRSKNLSGILIMMFSWGIGLSFHGAMYWFGYRKKKIGGYEKDDVFQ